MSPGTGSIPAIGDEVRRQLEAAGLSPDDLEELIRRAVDEDLDGGVDVTTVATVPADQRATLDLVAHRPGVVAGGPVAAAVFSYVCGDDAIVRSLVPDGTSVAEGVTILSVTGRTHDLLRAERPALNLLGHLSGIATLTRAWVDAISGSGAAIRDTRKTTPGMRRLEKYAVRCGGGVNHRMSLSDAALVKDNHVVAAGGVAAAFDAVRRAFPGVDVEVEVDSLDQLDEVLEAGADLVLLDNFTIDQLREAVRVTAGRARLEASGGLSLSVAADVASTGVDYLAVGALTHSAPVLDIGADLRQEA
jgi:nicotinate-nucleotide pyrophosphorylase (carboxylating)